MEIQELLLQHYGKFENHRILLNPGINIIYGGNEAGKTTVHSFIRAMLYGLNRGRGKAAKNDEYQVRQPWETPGAFLGSMRIQSQGKVYRVDRCFDRSTQPLKVTCETTLKEATDPEQAMDMLLGGVGEAAFANTLCIPQSGGDTGEALAQELRRYMINSDSAADGQMDVSRALQNLRKRKKQMEQQKKKEDEVLEADIEQRQARAERIRGEIELLKKQAGVYGDTRQAQISWSGPAEIYRDSEHDSEDNGSFYSRTKWILQILLFLAGALALTTAYFLPGLNAKIFLGICGVLFLVFIFPVGVFMQSGQEAETENEFEEPIQQLQMSQQNYQILEEIRKREEAYQKLQDELETLYHSHVKLDGADTEIAALTMAIDRICDLSSGIYAQSGRQLNERASAILSELTQGRYRRILLDETAEVRIHTPSRVLGLHQVSGGTMQQIYFALRMASAELLCGGIQLPILLDEPFAMYDDARLEAALRWLKNYGHQVILFTCQRREKEILERIW